MPSRRTTSPPVVVLRGFSVDMESSEVMLVSRVVDRQQEALAAVYEQHSQRVFDIARGLLGGQRALAEEVVQDVFLRFWDSPERFDPTRGSLGRYLGQLAYGRSIDLARSEYARRRREVREARLAGPDRAVVDCGGDSATARGEVHDALSQLNEHEREAIVLAYFLGYSYREVAAYLEVPEGTIKNRIRSGLTRLRVRLDPEEVASVS